MKLKHFIVALSLVSGAAFAQERIHPDLDVPKVDFREFDRHQQSIKDVLADIDFKDEGEVEALSVSIPDYKGAYAAFTKNVTDVLSTFESSMENLKKDAELGSSELSKLQGEYSSKLYALEEAMKKYPSSRDTFKKSYDLEHARMKADLSAKYEALIKKLQTSYSATLAKALQTSSVSSMNVRKPNFADRLVVITATPVLAVATIILWAAPAPIPVFYSPNGWCEGDSFVGNPGCRTFWGVLENAHHSILVKPKKEVYNAAVKAFGDSLFVNCKTAACAYEISKGYKKFFLKMADINTDIEVGEATLVAAPKVKKSRIKKLLKDATEYAAQKRPTAIFVK